jgi:putative tryptophan/tyrosine transport system substrate-binding protein
MTDQSKPCTERCRRIQYRNCLGLLAIVVTHTFGGVVAQAQQLAKIPRIGYLTGSSAPTADRRDLNAEAFQEGLRNLGYVEGRNIQVEYRYVGGANDTRTRLLATELVQLKVDVIVSPTSPGIRAAKEATKTIPIVMVTNNDPVADGSIDSLARPGGNVTGLTRFTRELSGKRLELLKEMVPTAARVGVLLDADSSTAVNALNDYGAAARALKITLQPLEVRSSNAHFDKAFQAAAKGRASALINIRTPLLIDNRKRIAELAIQNRLPSMSEGSVFVEAVSLVSYSSNEVDSFKRAAHYVDRILKGTKPADLPVEQPTKFEFVINLRTAKQIGLTIPPNVLARADRVIR